MHRSSSSATSLLAALTLVWVGCAGSSPSGEESASPAQAAHQQGLRLVAAGSPLKAELHLARAVELAPERVSYLVSYLQVLDVNSRLLLAEGARRSSPADPLGGEVQFEEALARAQRWAELSPADAAAPDRVGVCHYWLGDYDRELAFYKKALVLNPNRKETAQRLGEAFLGQGRPKDALLLFLYCDLVLGSPPQVELADLLDDLVRRYEWLSPDIPRSLEFEPTQVSELRERIRTQVKDLISKGDPLGGSRQVR